MRGVRLPRAVGCLVVDEDAPGSARPVGLDLLEPAQREVRDDVGGVARLDAQAVLRQEPGLEVLPLVDEHVPVVEALRVVGDAVALAVTHVPLADDRRAVAGRAQLGDEGRLRRVDVGEQRVDAVDVRVGAREDRRPARGAQRVRREAVLEPHSGRGDLVDPGRHVDPGAVGADRVRGVVVREDRDEVGSPGRGGLGGGLAHEARVYESRCRGPRQRALRMSSTRSLASPNSMAVLSRKKSGFWTPA